MIAVKESHIPDPAELAAAGADAKHSSRIYLSEGGVGDVTVAIERLIAWQLS